MNSNNRGIVCSDRLISSRDINNWGGIGYAAFQCAIKLLFCLCNVFDLCSMNHPNVVHKLPRPQSVKLYFDDLHLVLDM